MNDFYVEFKKQGTEIINYEKEEFLLLTDEKIELYNNKKNCHICKSKFHDVDDDGVVDVVEPDIEGS